MWNSWSKNSKLCQNLLDPNYRRHYRRFAVLRKNRKNRQKMLNLAHAAEIEEWKRKNE